MILNYYSLPEQPFGATPDPRYLFAGGTHREALASLLYGIEAGRGFIALIAKPGMGKTTILNHSLTQLRGKARTVFLFQTIYTPLDFLHALLADLGIREVAGGIVELQAKLIGVLMEQYRGGQRLVVVIDEAQNLDDSVLELIRMLSNFETPQDKLIQIVLSGQPELARKLGSPALVQLRQRISIIAHLQPFSREETAAFVEHRLRVAGWNAKETLFDSGALSLIAEQSEGIPRNINNLCFNALSLGCALKQKIIDRDIVREVIADLDLDPLTEKEVVGAGARSHSALAPKPSPNPSLGVWLPRTAAASVLMFALSGMSTQAGDAARVHADIVQQSKATASLAAQSLSVPSSLSVAPTRSITPPTENEPRSEPKTGTDSSSAAAESLESEARILVPPGVTLYQICAEALKSCHSRQLDEIQRLNPWLTNPDHLESGRKLRIPSAPILSAASQVPAKPSSSKSLTGVSTQ
jgi:general secretion pathway protein A